MWENAGGMAVDRKKTEFRSWAKGLGKSMEYFAPQSNETPKKSELNLIMVLCFF